ncbi:MAG: N-acetylmuramoyl-L-alanine amidase [Verrucomicrobium sp.]|nr:N-acetylmuramoyl-L-alanine amidase [Verrucomicrobium sp.]
MFGGLFSAWCAPVLAAGLFSGLFGKHADVPVTQAGGSPNPWFWMARYDGALTRSQFEASLRLFDPGRALVPLLKIDDQGFTLYPSGAERRVEQFHLAFATAGKEKAPWRYRTPAQFRAAPKPEGKPLQGLRIAIDPGHIGGDWGQVEDRSTLYPGVGRIQEGDMNLITARLLEKRLTALGATVFPTRRDTDPVTDLRPADLREEALAALLDWKPRWKVIPPSQRERVLRGHIEEMSHLLFERKYEFLARGAKIRRSFQPDVTLVLYINATPSSGRCRLVSDNRNIFFVEGAYTPQEALDPDEQLRLFYKVLDRVTPVEYEVAASIARAFTAATRLKPVEYGNTATTRLVDPGNYYVVARNLGANRQYDGPVVTTEPYFMNNATVARRLVAGDYEGERLFRGRFYPSIFREYADCVVAGLLDAYGPAGDKGAASNSVASLK